MKTNTIDPQAQEYKKQCNSKLLTNKKKHAQIATMTDQAICGCECEEIGKYKQKAHKSFMQVVEIEDMYKEQMNQLKIKYEGEIKKIRQRNASQLLGKEEGSELKGIHMQKGIKQPHFSFESPFFLEEDSISNALLLDQSMDSINHLKQFATASSVQQVTENLKIKIIKTLNQIKYGFSSDHSHISSFTLNNSQSSQKKSAIETLTSQIHQMFDVMSSLFQISVTSSEKYNVLFNNFSSSEKNKKKIEQQNENYRKQCEFMKQHIKRLTQQKLKLDKKNNDLERMNKILEKSVLELRKQNEGVLKGGKARKNEGQHIQIYADEDSANDNSDGEVVIDNSRIRGTTYTVKSTYTPRVGNPKTNFFMRDLHFKPKEK